MNFLSRFLAITLTSLLAFGPLQAQSSAPASLAPLEALQIKVEGAAGSTANPQSRTDFLVQVTDAAGAPISEAAITVRLPEDGASGSFADGKRTFVAYTDQSGRTVVGGIQWNSVPGTAAIKVTASKGTAHAGILLQQVVTAPVVAAAKTNPPAKTVQAAVTAPKPTPVAIAKSSEPAPNVEIRPAPARKTKLTPPSAMADLHPPVNPIATEPKAPESAAPEVSVTGAPDYKVHHGGKTKWILMAVAAAGAAGGLAILGGKKSSSSSSTSSSSSVSIGTPTISVGHP